MSEISTSILTLHSHRINHFIIDRSYVGDDDSRRCFQSVDFGLLSSLQRIVSCTFIPFNYNQGSS